MAKETKPTAEKQNHNPKLPTSDRTPTPQKPSVAHNADPKTVPATVHQKGAVG
jgi:hypothetical protein